jgi:hypothetical protein
MVEETVNDEVVHRKLDAAAAGMALVSRRYAACCRILDDLQDGHSPFPDDSVDAVEQAILSVEEDPEDVDQSLGQEILSEEAADDA